VLRSPLKPAASSSLILHVFEFEIEFGDWLAAALCQARFLLHPLNPITVINDTAAQRFRAFDVGLKQRAKELASDLRRLSQVKGSSVSALTWLQLPETRPSPDRSLINTAPVAAGETPGSFRAGVQAASGTHTYRQDRRF